MKLIKKILITNDDGYYASGIKVLKGILKKYCDEIYTVAPALNHSGSGRSITLGKNINFKKISEFDWIIEGTPTDCMIFALNKIFDKETPEFIFSGINSGSNVGDEISYSGTVGAAFEGSLRGIPSLALSQDGGLQSNDSFEISKLFLPKIISRLQNLFSNDCLLFNINFPKCKPIDVKDMIYTECSHQKKSDRLSINNSHNKFRIGIMEVLTKKSKKEDYVAIKNNFISLTPLSVNLTYTKFKYDNGYY